MHSFGQPAVPFPLDTDILNRFWKQNGELSTDKFKPVSKYHGMELLSVEADLPVISNLHILSEKAMTIGGFLGNRIANHDTHHPIWGKIKDMLALMGLLSIGKE